AQDDFLVAGNATLLDELASHGDGDATGGLSEKALCPTQKQHSFDDLSIGHVFRPAAGLADHLGREVAVSGIADRQRFGDGVRLTHWFVTFPTVLDGGTNRAAAGGLSAMNFAGGIIDESNLRQLLKGFLHFADEAAAGHGNDDVLRRPPAELLD